MAKDRAQKSGLLPCGCHVDRGAIVFCRYHGSVQKMATLLNALRSYFLDSTGEESPFVKRIDDLIPRPE